VAPGPEHAQRRSSQLGRAGQVDVQRGVEPVGIGVGEIRRVDHAGVGHHHAEAIGPLALDPFAELADRAAIGEVAGRAHGPGPQGCDRRGGELVRALDRHHVVTPPDEPSGHLRADASGRPGDERQPVHAAVLGARPMSRFTSASVAR
jgi:hypothetical protein